MMDTDWSSQAGTWVSKLAHETLIGKNLKRLSIGVCMGAFKNQRHQNNQRQVRLRKLPPIHGHPQTWPLHPLDPTDPHFQDAEEWSSPLLSGKTMELGQCDRDLAVDKDRAEMMGFGIKQRNKRLKIERQAKRQRLK